MGNKTVSVVQKILNANEQIAEQNRRLFDDHGILAVNIMASPGSGKTSLILKTIEALAYDTRIAVIEGDTAPVTIDSDKVSQLNIPVTQINTAGECHLDAMMVRAGVEELDIENIDLLIIENVGNLVCPAAFQLGEHINIVIASVPEGDDKPYKYPNIYHGIQALILNKTDLLPYVDFNMEYFTEGIRALNENAEIFPLSCKTGEGFSEWSGWLNSRIKDKQ